MKNKKGVGTWGNILVSSSLIATLLVSSMMPTNVLAYSLKEKFKENLNELRGYEKKGLYSNDLEINLEENPIRDGVNISSEESQSVIIEFKAKPLIEEKNSGILKDSSNNEVYEEHKKFNEFLSNMSKERSSNYSIKHSYYNTFNGVALDVKGVDIKELLESGVVKAIWKDEKASIEPSSTTKLKEGINPNARLASSTPLIGADRLRGEGLTGKGVKVAVLDTGVDYNHPDISENYKGGYDFVDNDNDPMEATYEDWKNSGEDEYYYGNPYYTSHGTHVSGTIAATGSNTESEFAVTGIAPKVDLYVYRVLGKYGIGDTANILAGIEQSVKDGMDVINLSLGIGVTDPLYPTSVACNNAALAGTVPVVANGNAGPDFSTLGSPGTSPLSISVGASSTAIKLETFNIAVSNSTNINSRLIAKNYNGLKEFTGRDLEMVYGGLGTLDEINNIDVKDKVLLIDRGEILFAEKLENAKNAGAKALIIANNIENSELDVYVGEAVDTVHCVGITMEDGQALKNAIMGASESLKVNFTVNGSTSTEADLLADFSSRGPALDETIKPDVTAPGVSIFSTFPEYINSPEDGIDYSSAYSRISGTSMATPHVAGVVALMLQNNPELSPEDIKVALMNTCDKLEKDYPINAMGAGRVNAYKAVHADTAVKVLDTTNTLNGNEEKVQIDYITGSLSFDRIRKGTKASSKSLSMKACNNSSENKTFNLSVRYLGKDELAANAADNGVEVKVPKSITINALDEVSFDASIEVPVNAEVGRYEGYVILTNSMNENEKYSVPFSATYVLPGIESINLSRPAVSNDLEMMHFAKISGVSATVAVSSPIKSVAVYVKDYDSRETFGYIGTADLSSIPGGSSYTFNALDSRASYFEVRNGKVTNNIKHSLKDGKYILEFIAEDLDTEDKYRVEKNILIDNEDAKMTLDHEAGVYEVNDSMYTKEDFINGDYEAFWVHGNVTDNSIKPLQEMGYNTSASDILISGFVNGMPRLSLDVSENGDFKFGIEKSDLESGQVYEFSPMPIDVATSQNLFKQPRYFFVKEGSPYTGVTLNKDSMNLNDTVTATVTTHNLTAGSSFNINLSYAKGFELNDVRINKQLQKIIDENNYTVNIDKSISGTVTKILSVNVSIKDKEGNAVDISGTNGIIDADLKLTYDSESEFYREYIQCSSIEILDKNGDYPQMAFNSTYEGVDVIPSTSTIFGAQLAEGFCEATEIGGYTKELDKYIWVEDNKGNKYDLNYDANMQIYLGVNLPVSDEEYSLISAVPGHFRKEGKFIPSRDIDGNIISKVYYLLGSEFYRYIAAGDVNGDGWIDILDALQVEKYYGQKVDYKENPVDFNFDGVVDAYDMDYIASNFGQYNEQTATGEPVLTLDGRGLDDVLNDTGYNTQVRLKGITLDKADMSLEVGESSKLNITCDPVDYKGKIKWESFCEDIATVDENGVVTAVNSGNTYIKASADNGQVNVYCNITVTKDGKVIEVESADADKIYYEMKVGEEQELSFNVNPSDAIVKSVNFNSAADSIITVEDGKAVAKSEGTTIVTADINSGAATVTWEIKVTAADEEPKEPADPKKDPQKEPGNSGDSHSNDGQDQNKETEGNPKDNSTHTGDKAVLPIIILTAVTFAVGMKTRKRRI